MTARTLCTIGYEKALLKDVLATLSAAGVVTSRSRAGSPPGRPPAQGGRPEGPARRGDRGRRDALHPPSGARHTAGRPPRQPAPRMGSVLGIVEEKLARPEAELAPREAAAIAQAAPSCLLCYESDWQTCNRRRVAEILCQRNGLAVRHLTVSADTP
jgi:hypothetical protein